MVPIICVMQKKLQVIQNYAWRNLNFSLLYISPASLAQKEASSVEQFII